MDSFDIMNPNMDSMLPPGDVYRKTFDTALMGLESKKGNDGGGSSGPDWEEVADLQHEQAMNSYEYDWDNTQRQYNHMLLQNEIQRHDQIKQHTYQKDEREQQWMYANAMKEQEYNAQMGAYNKSEALYGYQVEMNQIAAQMAYNDNHAQMVERNHQLMFETEKAAGTFGKERTDLDLQGAKTEIDYAGQKADLALQGQGVDLDIYGKRTAASRQKQDLTIKEQTKRGVSALQSVEESVKGMQALGQAKSKGQVGRSAEKQYQAIAAASGRLRAAKAYELNRSDLATRLALNGVDQTLQEQEMAATLAHTKIGVAGIQADAGYDISKKELDNATSYLNNMFDIGIRERTATALSITDAHQRGVDKIQHDQYAANVQADFNRMSEPTMGIPIPAPLAIPMATIMDPIIPVKGKEPVWGAGMGAGPSSAGSTGGGGSAIGGAIGMGLGAASAMIPGIGWGISALTLASAGGGIGSFIGGLFG